MSDWGWEQAWCSQSGCWAGSESCGGLCSRGCVSGGWGEVAWRKGRDLRLALLLVTHSPLPTTQHLSVSAAQSCPQWLLRHPFLSHRVCDHCWCQLPLHPSPGSALCSRHPPSSCHPASPPAMSSSHGEGMGGWVAWGSPPNTWAPSGTPSYCLVLRRR